MGTFVFYVVMFFVGLLNIYFSELVMMDSELHKWFLLFASVMTVVSGLGGIIQFYAMKIAKNEIDKEG